MSRPMNHVAGYCDTYSAADIRHLAEMAKRYTKSERGFFAPGEKIPGPEYSDLDCNIWSILVELCLFDVND